MLSIPEVFKTHIQSSNTTIYYLAIIGEEISENGAGALMAFTCNPQLWSCRTVTVVSVFCPMFPDPEAGEWKPNREDVITGTKS